MLLYIIALCKNQERPDKLELDEQRIITEYLTRRATFLHKKELLFLLLVNRTEWPPITKAPLTKIQFRRLWDLVSKRQAKERVYYRYINGVKTPFKVEAKLGEKSKHGNCVYSIVRHPGAVVVDFLAAGAALFPSGPCRRTSI